MAAASSGSSTHLTLKWHRRCAAGCSATSPRLEQILMRQAVDEVLIALPVRSRYAEIQRAIEICERGGVPARYLADVFQHRRNGKRSQPSR